MKNLLSRFNRKSSQFCIIRLWPFLPNRLVYPNGIVLKIGDVYVDEKIVGFDRRFDLFGWGRSLLPLLVRQSSSSRISRNSSEQQQESNPKDFFLSCHGG
ncbi:hypothetical protein, partial [Victivallis vadensis]|uniref:hypothetical protein n=1 Tax=Victivallis vadensis TaxID=172901 RepID=UPI001C9CDD82